ncbi:hypothetical protein [Acinetobacter sp. YH12239]|uniref:hypothetical protein n=1 Tax=Acinetobacter sp. YH12239 TaxID=2601166 RepID=UPI0015D449D5|nr:hypothetical protein [Acinetobacter sp. YH12239]
MKSVVIIANTAIGSVLSVAQAICNKINCKVYVICSDKKTSSIFETSKFISEVLYVDAINSQNYLEQIQAWTLTKKFNEKPVLYSSTDTSCYYINKNRSWFEENFILSLPSEEIIYNFTKKGLAEKKAELSGLSVPKTIVIKTEEDIFKVVEEFKFPVILKPRATYLNSNINFKIKVIDDKQDFINFFNEIHNEGILCQEFIPGGSDESYYYVFYRSKNKKIYENIGRKLLQSTPKGGIMLKGKSEFNEDLSLICEKFLESINYIGIGGIEFKKYGNKFYFIEMSVRLEGFFKIAEISGKSLALISYYDLADEVLRDSANEIQKDGYIYIDTIPLFVDYLKNRKFASIFLDLMKIFLNSKVFPNTFSKKDFKPFIKQILMILKSKI